MFDSMDYDATADLKQLQVPTTCSQQRLHTLVEALYRGSLSIDCGSAEELLRLGHHLGIGCIVDACIAYFQDYIAESLPVEVLAHCMPVSCPCCMSEES